MICAGCGNPLVYVDELGGWWAHPRHATRCPRRDQFKRPEVEAEVEAEVEEVYSLCGRCGKHNVDLRPWCHRCPHAEPCPGPSFKPEEWKTDPTTCEICDKEREEV